MKNVLIIQSGSLPHIAAILKGYKISEITEDAISEEVLSSNELILCESKDHVPQRFSQKCFSFTEIIKNFSKEDQQNFTKILLKFIQRFFTSVSIGCDHNGYKLAKQLIEYLYGCKIIQHLPENPEQHVDYPDYAWAVAEDVSFKKADFGILICKSGIGMSIAANKHAGIRAALCDSPELARAARSHNDANVLCLGSMHVTYERACTMVENFLSTEFEGGRHVKRIEKLSNFEKFPYNRG